MILEQNKETITYAFDFLQTTVGRESLGRKILEDENAEYFTAYRINVNKSDKDEIHSYFEKHYMDKVEFPSYSYCLKALVHDFLDIPEDYEIKRYKAIVGGPTSGLHLDAPKGAVFIFKDMLMKYGDTYKDGIYTIFRNVKDYYNKDENKERKQSFMKMLEGDIKAIIYDEFNKK